MNGFAFPHRRLNILTGEWVLVSPHRAERPWRGQTDTPAAEKVPAYDPSCPLCPGNRRASGGVNPAYTETFVFTNDFPALLADAPPFTLDRDGLLRAHGERGTCRVVCYSPRHDLFPQDLGRAAVGRVIDAWIDEGLALARLPFVSSIQIFENRGALMGCSNPHPHCQIWADERVPPVLERETERFLARRRERGTCLLCDYLALERESRERIVFENDSFAVLVPFWAVWPFEAMILPREHLTGLDRLSEKGRADLADALVRLETRYDNLFASPFPFSMGVHQRPVSGGPHEEWHFHFHFYPPLLRSAGVRKFMVGYELLAQPQRDITAEAAAGLLRAAAEETRAGST